MSPLKLNVLPALLCAAASSISAPVGAAKSSPLYAIVQSVPLGAPDRWDYITLDAVSHRLYVAHGSFIHVLDAHSGAIIGRIDAPGANGIAVVPAVGKGYAGSSEKKTVVVFDLQTLQVLKEIPADEDTDAVAFDPASGRVFVMEGDPGKAEVIDTKTDTLVTQLDLQGKPEFAVADEAGHLFINITDKRTIERVDTRTAKITATWSINACEGPHGLAIDREVHRLFSTCVNSILIVVDSIDGHVVATLPIGKRSDGAAFDRKRRRVFSSNGEGTLSVIQMQDGDHFASLADVTTRPSARTMALDSESGRVFLAAAERVELDPNAADPRKRYGVKPGSLRLLFADPVDTEFARVSPKR